MPVQFDTAIWARIRISPRHSAADKIAATYRRNQGPEVTIWLRP